MNHEYLILITLWATIPFGHPAPEIVSGRVTGGSNLSESYKTIACCISNPERKFSCWGMCDDCGVGLEVGCNCTGGSKAFGFACCYITKLLGCKLKERVVFTAMSRSGRQVIQLGYGNLDFRTIFKGTLIERQDLSRLAVHENSSTSNPVCAILSKKFFLCFLTTDCARFSGSGSNGEPSCFMVDLVAGRQEEDRRFDSTSDAVR